MSVDIVDRGEEGLKRLKTHSYRLILCDIMMPGVDGFRFLGEAFVLGIFTPIVMTTGYATVENAVRSLTCGAADFIAKPFTADELLTVVRRGLKYFKLQREAFAAAGPGRRASLAYVPCPPRYYRLGYVSWAEEERTGTVVMGLSDLFLKTIEGLEGLELLKIDDEAVQGTSCASVAAAGGARHPVMCPVGGRILEVNAEAVSDPSIVEKDPYFKGWLYRVLPSDLQNDLKRLISCSSDRM